MSYPLHRLRRLRKSNGLRKMLRETCLSVGDLIMPFFVMPGKKIKRSVKSMPGVERFSIDNLIKEVKVVNSLGIPAILLFGISQKKDERASEAYNKNGIVQQAIQSIKKEIPDIVIITDVCLCGYTSHGHCGVVKDGKVHNDMTLELLGKTALSHAEAGADIVAPSAMMDGQVKVIRDILDGNNFTDVAIMSYSAKYASSFYGPFREAVNSSPKFGDRKSYQMDSANAEEAIREVRSDIEEGADIVMIKPALSYLDVIYRVKQKFGHPIAAYNVSGEYSMVKAASKKDWIDEKAIVLEILTGIKRAGGDMIITYYAKEAAKWLKEIKS